MKILKYFKKMNFSIWIILGVLIPLLIGMIFLFLVFDNPINALDKMYTLRGKPNITSDAFSSLSDILTLLVTTYGILLTALFSYLVYTVSKQGVQISDEIKKLETSRDADALCEQALIVYHEFQRNILHLRDLYIDGLNTNEIQSTLKQFYFSDDWIRNIATLRSGLSTEEFASLYEVYNDFNLLKSLLNSNAPSLDIKHHVDQLIQKIFISPFPRFLIKEWRSLSAEEIINIRFFTILNKIYKMTFSDSQISIDDNNCVLLNNTLHKRENEKVEELYTSSGLLKVRILKSDTKKIAKETYSYNKKGEVIYSFLRSKNHSSEPNILILRDEKYLIDDSSKKYLSFYYKGSFSNNEITNGITTRINSKGNIIFRGYVDEIGNFIEGIQYDSSGKILFDGFFTANKTRLKGNLYENEKVIFRGEFKDGSPWNGEAINYSSSEEYVINFSGLIKDGKLHKGTGFRFKQDNMGETYEDRISQQDEFDYLDFESNDSDIFYDDTYINHVLRENYGDWADYQAADWIEGEVYLHKDTEENIKVVQI